MVIVSLDSCLRRNDARGQAGGRRVETRGTAGRGIRRLRGGESRRGVAVAFRSTPSGSGGIGALVYPGFHPGLLVLDRVAVAAVPGRA